MNDEPLTSESDDDKIVLCTVGELKMFGLRLPSITDDTPNDLLITYSVKNARRIVTAILKSWGLTPSQRSVVLKGDDHQRITDILHINMYLDVLVRKKNKLNWILGKNKAFSDMKVVDYIIENGTDKVVEYLALHANSGGW